MAYPIICDSCLHIINLLYINLMPTKEFLIFFVNEISFCYHHFCYMYGEAKQNKNYINSYQFRLTIPTNSLFYTFERDFEIINRTN